MNKEDLFKDRTCHDCGVKEGRIHEFGCDMEECPFCGNQLISCACSYKKLGYDYIPLKEPYCGLPKDVYENGLSNDDEAKWLKVLKTKGRIPYLIFPLICCRCGEIYPYTFMVSDEEWKKIIPISERKKVICEECYEIIKQKRLL